MRKFVVVLRGLLLALLGLYSLGLCLSLLYPQKEKILNNEKEPQAGPAIVESKDSGEDLYVKSASKPDSMGKRLFSSDMDMCADCPFREICLGPFLALDRARKEVVDIFAKPQGKGAAGNVEK